MTGRKTGCNWSRPVFFGFSIFDKCRNWQPKNFRICATTTGGPVFCSWVQFDFGLFSSPVNWTCKHYQQFRGPQCTDAEKLAIIGHILAPHPDKTAGWAAYEAEITNWNHNNYGRATYKTRLYPLTLGTSPVACGMFLMWQSGTFISSMHSGQKDTRSGDNMETKGQFNQGGRECGFQECQHQCQCCGRRRHIRAKGGL